MIVLQPFIITRPRLPPSHPKLEMTIKFRMKEIVPELNRNFRPRVAKTNVVPRASLASQPPPRRWRNPASQENRNQRRTMFLRKTMGMDLVASRFLSGCVRSMEGNKPIQAPQDPHYSKPRPKFVSPLLEWNSPNIRRILVMTGTMRTMRTMMPQLLPTAAMGRARSPGRRLLRVEDPVRRKPMRTRFNQPRQMRQLHRCNTRARVSVSPVAIRATTTTGKITQENGLRSRRLRLGSLKGRSGLPVRFRHMNQTMPEAASDRGSIIQEEGVVQSPE